MLLETQLLEGTLQEWRKCEHSINPLFAAMPQTGVATF